MYRVYEVCYIIEVKGTVVVVFFFFKQKTAYEMRMSYWSSDVCSSDLVIGFIFLKRMLNDRFANLGGLNQLNVVSVLGVINHFPDDVTQSREALKELLENRSVFAETINAIRTNIAYLTQGGQKKVIALTSEVSGEGKSFVSLNIAISMTKIGKKVLVMASDLRRSKLHRSEERRVGQECVRKCRSRRS